MELFGLMRRPRVMSGQLVWGALVGLLGLLAVGLVLSAAGCDQSTTKAPSSYLSRIVAAANAQNHNDPKYAVVASTRRVAVSESTAVRAVISECNEGSGTRPLVAGLVSGPPTDGSQFYWAVFVDPPGKHVGPSSEVQAHPEILNWIGGFVSVETTRQPFCDFGHASNLPPLPVFGK